MDLWIPRQGFPTHTSGVDEFAYTYTGSLLFGGCWVLHPNYFNNNNNKTL